MEKAFVWIAGIDNDGGPIRFVYKVILVHDGVAGEVYGGDTTIDSALSAQANEDALKLKVANDAAVRGYKLTLGDVIPVGSFLTKDVASRVDSTKGITSDKDATAVVEASVEAKPVGLMASLRDRFTSMWG